MLEQNNILLNLAPESKDAAIRRCGDLLANAGYTDPQYTQGMIVRDESFSVAIGNLIAIPHGEKSYGKFIKKTGLCVLSYPEGLDWNGTQVKLVIGIAALGDEHLEILENIVDVMEDEDTVNALVAEGDKEKIRNLLIGAGQ